MGTGLVDHPRKLENDAQYRAYLFGYLRLFRGSRRIGHDVNRKKGLHILLWFLLNPGKPCSADQFVEALWPDMDADRAISCFDVNLHAVKRHLEPGLGSRQESSFIRHHANRVYTFESAGHWWTDVADLELLYRRGHASDLAGDLERARFYYRRVSAYVSHGPLLDGETSTWVEPYRRRYALMCSQALASLMQIEIDGGRDEDLLEAAYQMLNVDRHNQLATRVIVESSLRNGNRHQAKRQLDIFIHSVRRDLGLQPPSEFCELQQRVDRICQRA